MSGLLDTDTLQSLFGSVFEDIYGDGELIRIEMTRQSNGSVIPVAQDPVAIKVQKDVCTEAMRAAAGYTTGDVRFLVLQSGVTGRDPNTDDRIIVQGEEWLVSDVTEDPARSYWQMRGTLKRS